jgi:25S rRNA (uracil2634-N3)-methyltransferase
MLQLGPEPIVPPSKKKQRKEDDDDDDIIHHDGFAAAIDLDDTEEQLEFLSQPNDVRTRGTVLITLRNVVPYTEW